MRPPGLTSQVVVAGVSVVRNIVAAVLALSAISSASASTAAAAASRRASGIRVTVTAPAGVPGNVAITGRTRIVVAKSAAQRRLRSLVAVARGRYRIAAQPVIVGRSE